MVSHSFPWHSNKLLQEKGRFKGYTLSEPYSEENPSMVAETQYNCLSALRQIYSGLKGTSRTWSSVNRESIRGSSDIESNFKNDKTIITGRSPCCCWTHQQNNLLNYELESMPFVISPNVRRRERWCIALRRVWSNLWTVTSTWILLLLLQVHSLCRDNFLLSTPFGLELSICSFHVDRKSVV